MRPRSVAGNSRRWSCGDGDRFLVVGHCCFVLVVSFCCFFFNCYFLLFLHYWLLYCWLILLLLLAAVFVIVGCCRCYCCHCYCHSWLLWLLLFVVIVDAFCCLSLLLLLVFMIRTLQERKQRQTRNPTNLESDVLRGFLFGSFAICRRSNDRRCCGIRRLRPNGRRHWRQFSVLIGRYVGRHGGDAPACVRFRCHLGSSDWR